MTVIGAFAEQHILAHGGGFATTPPVNHIQATNLVVQVEADVTGLIFTSGLSIVDALNGIRSGYYSWATTKLYYSLFYSLKALLIVRRYGLFHFNGKPGLVEIWPGGLVRKLTTGEAQGGSHGSALKLFEKFAPNHLLLTPVGPDHPLKWLKGLREEVNYNLPRFLEPNLPSWFADSAGKNPLRKLMAAYVGDNNLYAFNPDHAVLALPILALRLASQEGLAAGYVLDDADKAFLAGRLKDEAGPIAPLAKHLLLAT